MSRRTRVRIFLLVSLAVIVLPALLVGYLLAKDWKFHPNAPAAEYPAPTNLAEARAQDLDYLAHYLSLDMSYSDAAREVAAALIADLRSRSGDLSPAQFELGVSRVAALADNGHSNVWGNTRAGRFARLPLRGYFFADGYHVLRAGPQQRGLLGARIEAINGHRVEDLAAHFKRFWGGTKEGFLNRAGNLFLEAPDFLRAEGFADRSDAVQLTVQFPDGSTLEQVVTADPADPGEPRVAANRYLSHEPINGFGEDWFAFEVADPEAFFALREPARPFRLRLLEGGSVYVQYRTNTSVRDHRIEAFNEKVRETVETAPPRFLVLDLRFNGGGDYTKTANLMRSLPGLIGSEGRIYALTGPGTFSAGIFSLAFLRDAGREEGAADVIIVGTRIGDRERSWSETNPFVLPNSGVGMSFSTGLHDVANGCRDPRVCYWTDFRYPVAAGNLDPDIEAPLTFADFAAGRDLALEKVLEAEAAQR